MARIALGHNHVNGKASPAGVAGIGASAGSAHVILEVDTVQVTSMTTLRNVVNALLKNFEGQLTP